MVTYTVTYIVASCDTVIGTVTYISDTVTYKGYAMLIVI